MSTRPRVRRATRAGSELVCASKCQSRIRSSKVKYLSSHDGSIQGSAYCSVSMNFLDSHFLAIGRFGLGAGEVRSIVYRQ